MEIKALRTKLVRYLYEQVCQLKENFILKRWIFKSSEKTSKKQKLGLFKRQKYQKDRAIYYHQKKEEQSFDKQRKLYIIPTKEIQNK
ncbi:unnamed protein product [Paramecium pentaurelia]|uniref:Uncharacterized protein n=1 Tax=Paramecium pentaurelia TaxID=43138 RepID=A0A8S1YPQ8_9CILI|nr:unnamed protein product [Paramecium pentaurelia]